MPSDVIAEVFWRNTDEPPVSDNGQFTFIYASPYTLLGLIQVPDVRALTYPWNSLQNLNWSESDRPRRGNKRSLGSGVMQRADHSQVSQTSVTRDGRATAARQRLRAAVSERLRQWGLRWLVSPSRTSVSAYRIVGDAPPVSRRRRWYISDGMQMSVVLISPATTMKSAPSV